MLLAIPEDYVLRQIRVRQDPTEYPLNIAYGFWLRTLEPPGHVHCQKRILSRLQSSEADHVYLAPGSCGTAGIVSMEPTWRSGVDGRDYAG
jgi:hypothetical protein